MKLPLMPVLSAALAIAVMLSGCREEDVIYIPENVETGIPQLTSVSGFYLLNEGNMGSNKASLDYYDYASALYTRDIYSSANPDVPKELGDVGNDLGIYGSRLWAVINCSNKVEVLRSSDARRIGMVEIPNCRFVVFHGGYAYVSSYAGPVQVGAEHAQLGYVVRIDTATLEQTGRVVVGYQPDGMAVAGDRLYVANSGGYMVPNYENTLSVIDLGAFREIERIEIARNLDRVLCDRYGQLWITSRGDYYGNEPSLTCYDTRKNRITARLPLGVSDYALKGDSLYYVSTQWSYETMRNETEYGIVDVRRLEKVCDGFITDGTETDIKIPYSVAVNPATGEIYVGDARNYVTPGRLHCYSSEGKRLWSVRTGDVPSRIVFIGRE